MFPNVIIFFAPSAHLSEQLNYLFL